MLFRNKCHFFPELLLPPEFPVEPLPLDPLVEDGVELVPVFEVEP
jgi:hypothetical protein